MSNRSFSEPLFVLMVMAFIAVGCGSSESGMSLQSSLIAPAQGRLYGRVVLNTPPEGATVRVSDVSGASLGLPEGMVDSTGNFVIPVTGQTLPDELKFEVKLPAASPWDIPITAIVGRDKGAFCNVLTTAAVLYREKHQSSQVQSEDWVRRVFEIPDGVPLGSGVDESTRSFFRHEDFLDEARGRGGPKAFLSETLASSDSSLQLSDGANFVITLVADIASDAIGSGFGQLMQAISSNSGDPSALDQATEDLASIQTEATQLSNEVDEDFAQLEAELRTVSAASADLIEYQQLTTSLLPITIAFSDRSLNLLSLSRRNPITNEPFIPDPGIATFATNLASFDVSTALQTMSDTLLGQQKTGLLEVYRRLNGLRFGVAPPTDPGTQPVYEQTPILSNSLIFDANERFYSYYANLQILGLNLLVENANLSLAPNIIEEARVSAARFNQDLARQTQVAGLPLASDSYLSLTTTVSTLQRTRQPLPDSPSATIYYTQVMAPALAYSGQPPKTESRNGYDLIDFNAGDFEAPGYDGNWQITNLDDIQFIRGLALQANPTDVIAGLQTLGFSWPSEWDGTVWVVDYENPQITGNNPNLSFPDPTYVDEDDYVKLYNFNTNETLGYNITDMAPLYGASHSYILTRYQGFGPSENYRNLVAAGFRPTAPLSLSLSGGGSEVQAFLNGNQDVTQFCSFSSSSPSQLEPLLTQNGTMSLTWHPAAGPLTAQTITATLEGMDTNGIANTLTASVGVNVPSPAPQRTVTSLLLTPSNRILLDPTEQTPFKAIAFYDDRSVLNVTGSVTSWSIELPNGQPYPSGEATINGTVPGILIFTGAFIVDPLVVVKATLDTGNTTITGQTQLEVSAP